MMCLDLFDATTIPNLNQDSLIEAVPFDLGLVLRDLNGLEPERASLGVPALTASLIFCAANGARSALIRKRPPHPLLLQA